MKVHIIIFDILGNDENALSKAFSYLISIDKDCFFCFIKLLGIKLSNSLLNFSKFRIEIQRKREAGITDIEITDEEKIHIIVECKIKQEDKEHNIIRNSQKIVENICVC